MVIRNSQLHLCQTTPLWCHTYRIQPCTPHIRAPHISNATAVTGRLEHLPYATAIMTPLSPCPFPLAVVAQNLNTLTMHIDLATWVYVWAPVEVDFATTGPEAATVYALCPQSPSVVTNTTASNSVFIDANVASTITVTSKTSTSVFIQTPGGEKARAAVARCFVFDVCPDVPCPPPDTATAHLISPARCCLCAHSRLHLADTHALHLAGKISGSQTLVGQGL